METPCSSSQTLTMNIALPCICQVDLQPCLIIIINSCPVLMAMKTYCNNITCTLHLEQEDYLGHHFINILLLFLAPFHFQHAVLLFLQFQYLILNLPVLLLWALLVFLHFLVPVITLGELLVCRQK